MTVRTHRLRDGGAILVLTLIFVIVLAVIVLAVAQFAATGLRSSDVASERTDTNADASGAVNWAIERLASKHVTPQDCEGGPLAFPDSTTSYDPPNGAASVSITCNRVQDLAEPAVHLIANSTSAAGVDRRVEAIIEVPRYEHGARVDEWRVDLPISPSPYVPTTTAATTTTTTTTTATTTTTTVPSGTTTTTAPSGSTTTTTTTTTPPAVLSCRFEVTSIVEIGSSGKGKSGRGSLTVTNSGAGDASSWVANVASGGWQMTWDDVFVSGSYTVSNNASNGMVAAGLTNFQVNAANIESHPNSGQRIQVGQTFPCSM